jgi:hypothetical protein
MSEESDPLILINPPKTNQISSIILQYGFEIINIGNYSTHRQCPTIEIKINDNEIVQANTYDFKISNKVGTATNWFKFDPNKPIDIQYINENLTHIWNLTPEVKPINISIVKGTQFTNPYEILLYKDLTAPSFEIGLDIDGNLNLVPFIGEERYYSKSPNLFLNISDNIKNTVTVFYTVASKVYNAFQLVTISGADNKAQNLLAIQIPSWTTVPEGKNEILVSVQDQAGNPSQVKIISFIKDTTPPELKSGVDGEPWMKIGETDIQTFENPIYQTYVLQEKPTFYFKFEDSRIQSVRLYLNLSDIGLTPTPAQSIANNYGDTFIEANNCTDGIWVLNFPHRIWNEIGNKTLKLVLVVSDTAGNKAIFAFAIEKAINYPIQGNDKTADLFRIIVWFISSTVAASLISLYRLKKRARIRPLEEELKEIDNDLLDAALAPVDHVKADTLTEYTEKLGKHFTINDITPPDLQDFLKTNIQLINISEIKLLLNKYRMDTVEQEQFIREMLALTPTERKQFLMDYMENRDFENDDPDVEDLAN